MNELEKAILKKAHQHHVAEKRPPAVFRVTIRAFFQQRPVALAAEEGMINGIFPDGWLCFIGHSSERVNSAIQARNALRNYLRSRRVDGIEYGRADLVDTEIFVRLGYVCEFSRKLYGLEDVVAQKSEWEGLGLDCAAIVEIQRSNGPDPNGAALYSWEALDLLPDFEGTVATDRLTIRGQYGRPPGAIEHVVDADTAGRVRPEVDRAFKNIEEMSLAVRVKGVNLHFRYDGLMLTRAGLQVAEELPEKEKQAAWEARFQSDPLVDSPDAESQSTGGKIDDQELLELVDGGATQVEAAAFFGVSKQAVNKKLKTLRGDSEGDQAA